MVERQFQRVTPLYDAYRESYNFYGHYFLANFNDTMFEVIVSCDGNVIAKNKVDSSLLNRLSHYSGPLGNDTNAYSRDGLINKRLQKLLPSEMQSNWFYSVNNEQLIAPDAKLQNLLLKSVFATHRDLDESKLNRRQALASVGLWLEKELRTSNKGYYEPDSALLQWYIENVPLIPLFFGQFKSIYKAIISQDFSRLREKKIADYVDLIQVIAKLLARVDRDLHQRITNTRAIPRFGTFQKQLPFRIFHSKTDLDALRHTSSCRALSSLVGLQKNYISRTTQDYLQRIGIRCLKQIQAVNPSIFNEILLAYLHELASIWPLSKQVQRSIIRDSQIFRHFSNDINVTHHDYCHIDVVADSVIASSKIGMCAVCIARALDSDLEANRKAAIGQIILSPEMHQESKLNFNSNQLEQLLSQDSLKYLFMLSRYRHKNFAASERLHNYFINRDMKSMTDLQFGLFVIHKLSTPKFYFNKVARLFSTKPEYQHRVGKLKFSDSHSLQNQIVKDLLDLHVSGNLELILRELVCRDELVENLVNEKYWSSRRVQENKQSGLFFEQLDTTRSLFPLVMDDRWTQNEFRNLSLLTVQQIRYYGVTYSNWEPGQLVSFIRRWVEIDKLYPGTINEHLIKLFLFKVFQSQALVMDSDLREFLIESRDMFNWLASLSVDDLGEDRVLRCLDLLEIGIELEIDDKLALELFTKSIPNNSTSYTKSQEWNERLDTGLGSKIIVLPALKSALSELLNSETLNPPVRNRIILMILEHNALNREDLTSEQIALFLKALMQERATRSWFRSQTFDGATLSMLPNSALDAFVHVPNTLREMLMGLIKDTFAINSYTTVTADNESIVGIMRHIQGIAETDISNLMVEVLNMYFEIRKDVTFLNTENIYLEFANILTSPKIKIELLRDLFQLASDNFIDLSNYELSKAIQCFNRFIIAFENKIIQQLLLHIDTRVQQSVIELLKQYGVFESWWMFMAESSSPHLMAEVKWYVNGLQQDLFETQLLALLDSSIVATRTLAFEILEENKNRVDISNFIEKLSEHPAPDVWRFVMHNYLELQSNHQKHVLFQNILLTRRVARQIKTDLFKIIETGSDESVAAPHLQRLSFSLNSKDSEFALKFVANHPELFSEFEVQDTWSQT